MLLLFSILFLFFSLITAEAYSDVPEAYNDKLEELLSALTDRDVPAEWFHENLRREKFRFYENMGSYFNNMAEHRVSRGEISITDYKAHFGVDIKVRRGMRFIEEHHPFLCQVQKRNGIDYEVVVAILGMETNFGEVRQRGSFNVFDALVSQYLLLPNRERYAINQLAALYRFSQKINKDIDYFIGSFAGASGWGQFIPASLLSYFISADGIEENTDIFSIEDTLVSIENYLAAHKLNADTMNSPDHLYNAVFAYNRSDAYVQAVLYMYEEFRRLRDNNCN